jgi:hypothetical protein
MQRRSLRVLALLAVWLGVAPLLLGMGMTGGGDLNNPVRDFQAALVDKDGTKVEVTRVSIGGDVQLEGDMGRGTLRISFDNIKSVDFSPESHDYSRAAVHLKSGESVNLRVRNSLLILGRTNVGVYQIRARDLQSITFKS